MRGNFRSAKTFEERLTSLEKTFYETTKTYGEATREAASLFHLLQSPDEQALPREMLLGFFHEKCALRDRSAFEIASDLEDHQPFFETFKVSEEKILAHASRGKLRMKARTYLGTQDPKTRADGANELLKIFHGKEVSPHLRMLCQQEGVELQRLKFDVALQECVKTGEIPRNVSKNISSAEVFHPIQEYLKASQQVGKVWKMRTEAKSYVWEQAILERRLAAQRLRNNEPALCVFKAMNPDRLPKLEAHAGVVSMLILLRFSGQGEASRERR